MNQTDARFTVKVINIRQTQGGFLCLMDAFTGSGHYPPANASRGGWSATIFVPLANIDGPLGWAMSYIPDSLDLCIFERPSEAVVVQVERIIRRTALKVLKDLQTAITCPACNDCYSRPVCNIPAKAGDPLAQRWEREDDEWEQQCQKWRGIIAAAKEGK